jgi:hypothetical protein
MYSGAGAMEKNEAGEGSRHDGWGAIFVIVGKHIIVFLTI